MNNNNSTIVDVHCDYFLVILYPGDWMVIVFLVMEWPTLGLLEIGLIQKG
jgi:hypothetical protein